MEPRSISNEATSIYSTCLSVDSAGYWDLSLFEGLVAPLSWGVFLAEDRVDGVLELLSDSPYCVCATDPVFKPSRIEELDGILVAGKDDSEG